MSDIYLELEKQLKEGKITPMEFVERYNELIRKESEKHAEPFEPREHI